MSEYIGKHRPTDPVEAAAASVRCATADAISRTHGLGYKPRHKKGWAHLFGIDPTFDGKPVA